MNPALAAALGIVFALPVGVLLGIVLAARLFRTTPPPEVAP